MLQLQEVDGKKNPYWLVANHYSVGTAEVCSIQIEHGPDLAFELIFNDVTLSVVPNKNVDVLLNDKLLDDSAPLVHSDTIKVGFVAFRIIDPQFALDKALSSPTLQTEAFSWWLESQVNSKRTTRIPLMGEMIVGRSANSDLVLSSANLSRKHAKLVSSNETLHVVDLGSSNGTFLNGNRLHSGQARDGDVLCFDTLCFKVSKQNQPDVDIDKTTMRAAISDSQIKVAKKRAQVNKVKAVGKNTGEKNTPKETLERNKEKVKASIEKSASLQESPSILPRLIFFSLVVVLLLVIIYSFV
ncbi:MAG: hypothetical protein ACI93R_002827 [Flavobacteriales bacterium]|jgi:hypothetical protein